MYQIIEGVKVWGTHEAQTIQQLKTCMEYGSVADAALMADGHFGYSQPIGGVIGYRNHVSPSGVGYDIACGNKAVRTLLKYSDVERDLSRIADEVAKQVQFGIGKVNIKDNAQNHPLFDDDRWNLMWEVESMKIQARNQLGTVGSGNHYVDVFVENDIEFEVTSEAFWEARCVSTQCIIGEPHVHVLDGQPWRPVMVTKADIGKTVKTFGHDSRIWVGVHFGSRGFGHKTATGFMNLSRNIEFFGKPRKGEVNEDVPVLIPTDTDLGQAYATIMGLAGDYAYAGRDYVVQQVLSIMGTSYDKDVHNHHNFAWLEEHGGEDLWVVRKGATPLHPGQESFIGGSMCDPAVIVKGLDGTEVQKAALFSTVHGAGRVMGRMAAKGKVAKDGTVKREPGVKREDFNQIVRDYGIQLRGSDVDESPFVYRRLNEVLANHEGTLDILHELRPVIVCMAGDDVYDPYKD